jgi:elongation factor G
MGTGGPSGYPVVDVKATLFDGDYHEVDSSDLAFCIAGSMAVKSGVAKAKPILLEPIMKMEIVSPPQFLGDTIAELSSRRARIDGIDTQEDVSVIRCFVPLGETFGFATDLRSVSQGRATHNMEFYRYEELPPDLTQQIMLRAKAVR